MLEEGEVEADGLWSCQCSYLRAGLPSRTTPHTRAGQASRCVDAHRPRECTFSVWRTILEALDIAINYAAGGRPHHVGQ